MSEGTLWDRVVTAAAAGLQQSGFCGSLTVLGEGGGGEGEAKVLHKALQGLLKGQGKSGGFDALQGHTSACVAGIAFWLVLRHCFLAR